MISERLSRRRFLLGSAGFAGVLSLPGTAGAMTRRQAEAYVERLVTEVLLIVNSGAPEATILRRFETTFRRYSDLNIIARSSLGVAWRRASEAQRKAYTEAFSRYVSIKYGRQFTPFKGATVSFHGSRDAGKKGILVKSMVHTRGRQPFEIEWQLSDRSGALKVFNLIIEGISMLSAEREEIGNMLEARRGNIELLIADLKSYN